MIIAIREKEGSQFRIVVPTGLLLNGMTAHFLPKALERKGVELTADQMKSIIKAIRSCRKINGGWKLVEVDSADGDHVEIIL